MDADSGSAHTYLVEHYWPDATTDTFRDASDRLRAAARTMALASQPIRFLHSTLVPEEENAFCVFSATSPALVEEAYRRAGVPFERIVDALELDAPKQGGRP
jgi:hypothetical protein